MSFSRVVEHMEWVVFEEQKNRMSCRKTCLEHDRLGTNRVFVDPTGSDWPVQIEN